MDKKRKIIIGTSVGAGILLCLGTGLGVGLSMQNKHVNDPVLEKKYIEYRKDYVKKICSDLYQKNKNKWSNEYEKIIKKKFKTIQFRFRYKE